MAEFTSAYVKSPTSGEMISHGKPNLPPAKEFPYCGHGTAAAATLDFAATPFRPRPCCGPRPAAHIPDATAVARHALRRAALARPGVVDRAETPDPWPEAGWLCFPLRPTPELSPGPPGRIVDPAKDLVRSSNHEVFCLNGGLVVTAADGGRTGICPIDGQLVSLGRPGLWHYTRDFTPAADVFVMLFNNVYSTNFAQWIDGSWSSRVRLWATRKSTPRRDADRRFVGSPRRLPRRRDRRPVRATCRPLPTSIHVGHAFYRQSIGKLTEAVEHFNGLELELVRECRRPDRPALGKL